MSPRMSQRRELPNHVPPVIAVVPTYRPDATLPDLVVRLRRQVQAVIVVDDGSPEGSPPQLDALEGVLVLRNDVNSGIAASLNRGVREALRRGAEFVLTMDQDSELPDGFVETALETFARAAGPEVGMVVVDTVNGRREVPTRRAADGILDVDEAIQSGTLISARTLRECGLFDERLFIDGVDTEYCLRVRKHGFRVAVAEGTDLTHALGSRVPFRPFGVAVTRKGRESTYQYHPPFRHYFVARNSVDIAFRYARRHPGWTATFVRREVLLLAVTIVSGPFRLRHLIASVAGLGHGLMRRRGPMPAGLRTLVTPGGSSIGPV